MTYDEQNLVARLEGLLDGAGLTGRLRPDQLERLDQYHVGGLEAVDKLLVTLGPTRDTRILDVGCGFGGPARHIAATSGAAVVGIDVAGEYIEAATLLTSRCGLTEHVTFEHTELDGLQAVGLFDAAITIHVQMNIADKTAWYLQIASHLRDGGRLAIWDVCTKDHEGCAWPMPWSIDGTDSHLVTPEELRSTIVAAGFELEEWADETAWSSAWFRESLSRGVPADAALPALLEDGRTRFANFGAALRSNALAVVRGQFRRSTRP